MAKALDPNMYRNIEFDSWNEMRKELKFQHWYNGDTNFKVFKFIDSFDIKIIYKKKKLVDKAEENLCAFRKYVKINFEIRNSGRPRLARKMPCKGKSL